MSKGVFITVRTGSTRLPKKSLLEICGKPTIEYVIQRAKSSRMADLVVLCTTDLKEDEPLCEIARKNGISYYRGIVNDKLARWLGAAKKFDINFFVTADGDDLFCESELIDMAFKQHDNTGADFIEGKDLACGAFTYGIKRTALEKVCSIKDTDDTEMMWVYFKDTGLFKTEILENVPLIFKRPEIRMTLDYEDDLKFFKRVIEHFAGKKANFNLRDVIGFLDENSDIIRINQYLQERFVENQRKNTKLIIKQKEKR